MKNPEALHKLNTFLMTIKLEEQNTESEGLAQDYEDTLDRLLAETLSEKKEKKLNER